MRFRFDPEHEEFRRTVRRFFDEVAPPAAVRRDLETGAGWNPATWQRLCEELELPALAVPTEFGGAGFGLVELGIVLTEAGRCLLCAPLLSTSIAARVVVHAGDPRAAGAYLPGLASGVLTGTLAAREPGGGWDATPATRAAQTAGGTGAAGGWTVTGTKDWVLDGHTAGLLVVTASTADGPGLFLVDGDAPGVRARPLPVVDPTRKAATVSFEATPAVPLGSGSAALGRALDEAVVLLAAEQVGVAEACLDAATGYARTRHQFGRPIGSFQAVKHKLADVLLEVEAARSAAMYAGWAADERPDELALVAGVAGVTCSAAALLAAGENIQVHGGMGATWEHPAHLYLRRATTSRLLLRAPSEHLDRIARLTGIGRAGAAPSGAAPSGGSLDDGFGDDLPLARSGSGDAPGRTGR